jgi:hypothetical protein
MWLFFNFSGNILREKGSGGREVLTFSELLFCAGLCSVAGTGPLAFDLQLMVHMRAPGTHEALTGA